MLARTPRHFITVVISIVLGSAIALFSMPALASAQGFSGGSSVVEDDLVGPEDIMTPRGNNTGTGSDLVTCGRGYDYANACKEADFPLLIAKAFDLFLRIVTYAFFLILVYLGIKMIWASDKAQAWAEIKKTFISVGIGIVLLIALFNMKILLQLFGVKDEVLRFLPPFGVQLVESAYAQNLTEYSPIRDISFQEFVTRVIRVITRVFVIPSLVFVYAYVGFLFVYARGKPEMLQKAKLWLLYAVGGTFILFMAETIAYALQNTITRL